MRRKYLKRMEKMRKKTKLGISVLISSAIITLTSSAIFAQTLIKDIFIDGPQGEVVIQATSPTKPRIKLFSDTSPRVVIDLDNASLDFSLKNNPQVINEITSKFPAIQKFMMSEYGSGITTVRLVFNSNKELLNQFKVSYGDNNRISIHIPEGIAKTSNYTPPSYESKPSFSQDTNYSTSSSNDSQVAQLRDEVSKRDRLIKDLKADIEFLKQQAPPSTSLSVSPQELENLRNQNNSLKQELATTKSRLALAAERLTTSGSTSEELEQAKSQMNSLRDQLNQAIQKIKSLSQTQPDSEKLKQELNAANQKIQSLLAIQNELNETKTMLSSAEKKIEELSHRASASTDLKSELEEAKTSAQENETQLNKALTLIDALKEKMAEYKTFYDRNSRCVSELDVAKGQIAELRQQISAGIPDKNSYDKVVNQLEISQQQLRSVNAKLTEANTEVSNLKNEVNSYKDQSKDLTDAETKIGQLASKLAMADERIIELDNQIKTGAGDKKVDSLKSELAQLKINYNNNQQLLEKAKTDLDKASKQLVELASLKGNYDNLTKELENQKALNKQLSDDLALIGDAKTVAQKMKALQVELTEARNLLSKNRKHETDFIDLKQQLEELTKSLREEKSKVNLLSKKNDLLSQQSSILSKTVEASTDNERVTMLKNEINALNYKLEDVQNQSEKQVDQLKEQLAVASSVILSQSEELSRAQNLINDLKTGITIPQPKTIVTNKAPDDEKALDIYKKADKVYKSGDMENAIKLFNKVIKTDPNFVRPYVMLGAIYSETGDMNSAMENLKTALLLDPDNSAAHHYLGNVYFALGNYDRALEQFKLAIGINALSNYSAALKNQGNIEAAITTYKAAVQLSPSDADLYYNLASAFKATSQLKQAIAAYKQALTINPEFSNAHYNIALTYAQLGNNPEAIKHFKEYLRLNPNSKDAAKIKNIITQLQS